MNVKFEGSKVRKTYKKVIFEILQSMTRAPRKLDTCANTSKLQVDIFWELGIIIYHLRNFGGKIIFGTINESSRRKIPGVGPPGIQPQNEQGPKKASCLNAWKIDFMTFSTQQFMEGFSKFNFDSGHS